MTDQKYNEFNRNRCKDYIYSVVKTNVSEVCKGFLYSIGAYTYKGGYGE